MTTTADRLFIPVNRIFCLLLQTMIRKLCSAFIIILIQCHHISAWKWNPDDEHPCNIHRTMTYRQVLDTFGPSGIPALFPEPVIIRASDSFRNEKFRKMSERDEIIQYFGEDFNVTLSSSNSLSENRRTIPLKQYINEIVSAKETFPDQLSNESWYLFGETYSDEWSPFLENYEIPPCYTCSDWPVALAFGIGNRGSGVQWHTHGKSSATSKSKTIYWCI